MGWFKKHKILTAILVIVLIAIIASAASGGSKKTENNTQPANQPAQQTQQPEQPKVTLDEFYQKVQNGQTKAEVAAISGGREPSGCTETENQYIGKTESCNYGGFSDKGLVNVTYTNDKVSNKLISKY